MRECGHDMASVFEELTGELKADRFEGTRLHPGVCPHAVEGPVDSIHF